ncbi:MAG: hypothetical protein ACTHLT_18920 [Devosia sp.]
MEISVADVPRTSLEPFGSPAGAVSGSTAALATLMQIVRVSAHQLGQRDRLVDVAGALDDALRQLLAEAGALSYEVDRFVFDEVKFGRGKRSGVVETHVALLVGGEP